MQLIKTVTANIQPNEQTQKTSQSQPISTTIRQTSPISREEHAALFAVINKSRMLNGWTSKTAQELDATIRVWFEIFSDYKIPVFAYELLYRRAIDTRQAIIREGKEPPPFTAELLIACWTGQHGLKSELEQKRIEEHRYLPDTAKSTCPRCLGTGWATEKDSDGYEKARKCVH